MRHRGFDGIIGVAREDITPPVGIFCRNWGAATHDAAEGVHRPLSLSVLSLQQHPGGAPLVLVDTDLGWFADLSYARRFHARLLRELGLSAESLIFALSHTHSAPPLCDPNRPWPAARLLAPSAGGAFPATID